MNEKEKINNLVELMRRDAVRELYSEAFNLIQALGNPGLHSENYINRQAALDALKSAYQKIINS